MDKELFEAAIAPYVADKHINPDNHLVTFELLPSRRKTHSVKKLEKKIKSPQAGNNYATKRVMTPAGLFDSCIEAATHYGITGAGISARIKRDKEKGKNDYYFM